MEVNTSRRAAGLREKIPDIKKTLEMVTFLKARKESSSATPLETNFELNDTLYARATVDPADTEEVYLWLGANVMLAYPIAEAQAMLEDKLAAAEQSLANCDEDLEFLREQITVCLLPFLNRLVSFHAANVDFYDRRWRLLQRACIIGMWCRGGKRGLRERRRPHKMIGNAIGQL